MVGVIEKEITKTSMLVNYFTEDGLIKNTGINGYKYLIMVKVFP